MGSPYSFEHPRMNDEQDKQIIARLFEQLMIFDCITITTSRINFALYFLIKNLGINTVERLFESGYLKLMIWSPLIVTGNGRQRDDGTIDESVIFSQPPIAAASLSDSDTDPEKNIQMALQYFDLHRDRKRIFARLAAKNYVVPNGMDFSKNSTKLVLDAYENNSLAELGLPNVKEPTQLNLDERKILLNLGHKVLETTLLSKYHLKSYENFEHYSICKQNINNIGKAYNITDNSDKLFNLEGLPNLRELFLQEKISFDSVFKYRHLSNAKFYRKWINEKGENSSAIEITKEYLNEIKRNNSFFESSGGKFIKNLGLFGINTALTTAIAGPLGVAASYPLGLLEDYWLNSLLIGKTPSMFIEDIRREIPEE
ncbi:MAG TPA: hypothetical protein VIK55_17405 [Paludibacter sp.]